MQVSIHYYIIYCIIQKKKHDNMKSKSKNIIKLSRFYCNISLYIILYNTIDDIIMNKWSICV